MKAHWSNPDYGILDIKKQKHILVRINFIDPNTGLRDAYAQTVPYRTNTYESARSVAGTIRDRMLERPEVKAYLDSAYAAPSRLDNHSRSRGNTNACMTDLAGISVSYRDKTLASGKRTRYYSIRASVYHGCGNGESHASWSITEYGLLGSIEKAVKWRSEQLQSPYPSQDIILKSVEQVCARYLDIKSS